MSRMFLISLITLEVIYMALQVSLSGAGVRLSDIVCNASLLERFLTMEGGDSMPELQASLCAVDPDTLQQAEQLFLSQLDYSKIFTVSDWALCVRECVGVWVGGVVVQSWRKIGQCLLVRADFDFVTVTLLCGHCLSLWSTYGVNQWVLMVWWSPCHQVKEFYVSVV